MVICPKCSHVRPPNATNPEWQCPACGVCYAKARDAQPVPAAPVRNQPVEIKQGWDWGTLAKIILFIAVGWGATQFYQSRRGPVAGAGAGSEDQSVDARLRAAAAGLKPDDLVLYGAEWCGYCKQAKETFAANDIPYINCDAEADPRCAREYADLHGQGFPLFVVRGKRLREGLNYEELIAALETR